MYRFRNEEHAQEKASEYGYAYGHSAFSEDPGFYVGRVKDLQSIGCPDITVPVELTAIPDGPCGCSDDYECSACKRRVARRERNELVEAIGEAPFYVALYSVNRMYGGPEEGGWWYDWTMLHTLVRVKCWEHALRWARTFRDEYGTNEKPGRYNVNGGTDYQLRIVRTAEAAESRETKERPYYC